VTVGSAFDPVSETIDSSAEPLTDLVSSTLPRLSDATGSTAETLATTGGSLTEPATAALSTSLRAATSIGGQLTEAAGYVASTPNSALSRFSESAGSTFEPLTDTVGPIADPVTDTVGPVAEPVTGTVSPLVEPVAETIGSASGPVTEAVAPIGEPVEEVAGSAFDPITGPSGPAEAAEALEQTVEPLIRPAVEQTTPATDAIQPAVETSSPVADTVLQPVGAVTGPVGDELQPVVGSPTDSIIAPPDPGMLPDVDAFETLARPIDASVAVSSPEPSEPFFGGDAWEALSEAVLGFGMTEAQVLAGVTGLAAVGVAAIARGISSPTSSVLFTNVRLLPCVATSTIQQSTAAVTSAVSHLGGQAAGERSPNRPRPAARPDLPVGTFRDSFKSPSDGYRRIDLYEGSERLLAQVGAVLGAVYLAFLAIWVGLTRARWNGGLRSRG
jgi:hypothetical protein